MRRTRFIASLILALLLASAACAGPAAAPAKQDTSPAVAPQSAFPKVLELRIDEVRSVLSFVNHPEVQESHTLRFHLTVRDRVEGLVELDRPSSSVFCNVIDPYGNMTIGSARRTESRTDTWVGPSGIESRTHPAQLYGTQTYPWKFAFIAAAEGEYYIRLDTGWTRLMPKGPSAYVRLTIHKE